MGNISGAVRHLKKELKRAQQEVERFYRGTSGFGKLKLEPASHIVCVGSQTHKPCTESEMEKGSKGIAASSGGNCFGSCEAHHVGIRPQEDRDGAAGTVGEGEGGSQEGGVGPNRFTFS